VSRKCHLIPPRSGRSIAFALLAAFASVLSAGAGRDTHDHEVRTASAAIDARDFRHHIEVLSSDDFEGRSPGTPGEALTVRYLERQFKAISRRQVHAR